MFSDVVMEINKSEFDKVMDEMKERKGVVQDTDLDASDLKELVAKYKELYIRIKGEPSSGTESSVNGSGKSCF